VAVVTTSGTAVLNLAPAVVEACYRHVPLLILTADRPVESIPQFNNQVIDQVAPFYNYTKGFYEMPLEPRDEHAIRQAMLQVETLVKEGQAYPPGPVHINVPLLEPLYELLPEPELNLKIEPVDPWQLQSGPDPLPEELVGRKTMVLAGAGRYDQQTGPCLERLLMHPSFVVVTENLSNLHSEQFISQPEVVLGGADETERPDLMPEVVIGLGGQLVSKRMKTFIQSDPDILAFLPDGDPSGFIRKLIDQLDTRDVESPNAYLDNWKSLENRVMKKTDRVIDAFPFCNLTAIREVIHHAPPGSVLHLGNSTTIRYAQLLPGREDLLYDANRGTSGIDGSLSTAVGAALVSDELHLLVVGDLSFVYDSNALWNKNFPDNLRIIVLNDGGGSIFRILDGPDRMEFFEEYSVTHHPVSLELLAQAFGKGFARVSRLDELKVQLGVMMEPETALRVLEVDTTASENSRIFTSFFEKIK
jgi:2-succinyl-5-enolpyruvyl-6-hydroxy-3-cyclohexene-1-carboxylate synthase